MLPPENQSQKLRFAIGILCIGLSLTSLFLGSRKGHQSSRLLVFKKSALDFGEKTEAKYKKSFEVTNESPHDIEIINVRRSCRCSNLRFPSGIIAAGATVSLDLTWDLRGQSGEAQTDLLINYKTLDKENRTYSTLILMQAKVTPDFDLAREVVFERGEKHKQLQLKPNMLPDAKLLSASCAHPAVTAKVSAPNLVDLHLDSGVTITDRIVELEVKTNSANSPALTIPIRFVEN